MDTSQKIRIAAVLVVLIAAFIAWWAFTDSAIVPNDTAQNQQQINGSVDDGDTNTMDDITVQDAMIDSVEVQLAESFPVQVWVVAKGNFRDGCSQIHEQQVARDGNTFTMKLTTKRAKDKMCTQALVPFEERIKVQALGLEAGSYTVSVNGVTSSFTLDVDNVGK